MKTLFSILILLSISFKANSIELKMGFCASVETNLKNISKIYMNLQDKRDKNIDNRALHWQQSMDMEIIKISNYSTTYKNLCKN